MKLALGTAQFGFPYGVSNTTGAVGLKEIEKILEIASNANINTIDTAIGYGDCQKKIGKFCLKRFKIVTKLPKLPYSVVNVDEWVRTQVALTLDDLNVDSIYGLLIHHSDHLNDPVGLKLASSIATLKSEGIVELIGASLYSPNELESFDWKQFGLYQVPYNLIDRKFEKSGLLSKMFDHGVELHARSCFLQGLLLMNAQTRPKFFEKWSFLFDRWEKVLASEGYDSITACLSHSLNNDTISKSIIGVQSARELMQVIDLSKRMHLVDLAKFAFLENEDEELCNPSLWRMV